MNAFEEWLRENTHLSESSIYKYAHAIGSISKDMMEQGVLSTDLASLSAIQLDVCIKRILDNPFFENKNTVGNHMYSNALKQFRMYRAVDHIDDRAEVQNAISEYAVTSETEREALVKSRVGQGLFKKRLLAKYDNRCMITGISNTKLLIASHIKPWAVSNNIERLSEDNGFILTPTFDKLFDCGLISFRNDGEMLISTQLSTSDKAKLQLSSPISVNLKSTPQMLMNLEYHRDVIFVRK